MDSLKNDFFFKSKHLQIRDFLLIFFLRNFTLSQDRLVADIYPGIQVCTSDSAIWGKRGVRS